MSRCAARRLPQQELMCVKLLGPCRIGPCGIGPCGIGPCGIGPCGVGPCVCSCLARVGRHTSDHSQQHIAIHQYIQF
eukprot:365558-Chlamydomonas_euryale.AAC.28